MGPGSGPLTAKTPWKIGILQKPLQAETNPSGPRTVVHESRTTIPGIRSTGSDGSDRPVDDDLSPLGVSYLARFRSPLAAYNRLQTALMRRFMNRGGTMDRWLIELAPAFRQRYGWLCQQPVLVRVETGEHRLPYRRTRI